MIPPLFRSPGSRWPLGLTLAFALFLAGTLTLIWISRQVNLDLVRPDYYEAELVHDEELARRRRAAELPQRLLVAVDPAARLLRLRLPPGHESARGTLQLYRPSAAGQDREYPLQCNANGEQILPLHDLAPGLWRLRVTWRVGETEYAEVSEFVLAPHPQGTGSASASPAATR